MTQEQFKIIVPNISESNLQIYLPLLNDTLDKYQINTIERKACFIAQIAHESGSFKHTQELASGEAYEGRMDLGNIYPGNGIKFKGHGLIQITGRANHRLCSLFLYKDERLLNNPLLITVPPDSLLSAYWFWNEYKHLNEICDRPDDWTHEWRGEIYNKFQWLTIKINGGLNGYNDRLEFYQKAIKVLKNGNK